MKVLNYQKPPDNEFSPCAECGESFTNLKAGGRCWECAEQLEKESAKEEMVLDRPAALQRLGVPSRLAKVEFEEPSHPLHDYRRSDLEILNWRGDPWAVLLIGPVGTGKTCYAVELLFRPLGNRQAPDVLRNVARAVQAFKDLDCMELF